MMEQVSESALPWEADGWLEEVEGWIAECVQQQGWQLTGKVQLIHQRPWSAFASARTDHGIVYFKAPAPAFTYEVALTQTLARWRPDCTVPLLGVDVARGWLLSAAAGETLRSLTRSPEQIEHWLQIMPLYAELQIELALHMPALTALGLPDRRFARLPQLYTELLADTGSLLLGLESGLTHDEYRRLREANAYFGTLCARLEAYELPETLVHEEVHENNVIFGNGRYTFTDWSDCSVGHPFFSWLVTERTLVHWLKLEQDGPELQRVRDAYLEPWRAFASRAELLEALDVASSLAMVNRALSWRQGLATLTVEQKADYADSVAGWLQDFLVAAQI